jgi:hypothetical protein
MEAVGLFSRELLSVVARAIERLEHKEDEVSFTNLW